MEQDKCYICLEGEGGGHGKTFIENPCNCKGSIKVHDACFDQLCTLQNTCGACNSRWVHDYAGRKHVIFTNIYGDRHGAYEQYYGNGKIVAKGTYVDGKLEGVYQTWHKNGIQKSNVNYQNGNMEGLCQMWYENGQLLRNLYYKNGKIHGPYTSYYEDGSIKEDSNYVYETGNHTSYYQNGRLKDKVFYKDGKVDGVWQWWNEDGTLLEKVFSNGVEVKEEDGVKQKEEEVLPLWKLVIYQFLDITEILSG